VNVYHDDPLRKVFLVALTFSLFIHLIIFTGPWNFFHRNRRIIYSPYRVKLVGGLPSAAGGKSASKGNRQNSRKMVSHVKRSVTLPARTRRSRVISVAKKKKSRRSKTVTKSRKKVARKSDEFNLAKIGNFIKELKKKRGKEKGAGGEGRGEKGKGKGGELLGARAFSVLQRAYFNDLIERIKDEWILPPQLKNEKRNLVVIVAITIAADGRILRAVIEKSSGNAFYDESALRAVKKLGQLPPPPFNRDKITIGLRFNLRELQR